MNLTIAMANSGLPIVARSSTLSNPHVKTLLKIALDTQANTISWVLVAAGITYLLSLLLILILQFNRKRVQRKPTTARKIMVLKRMTLFFVWLSAALVFGASLATSQLARAIHRTSASSVGIVASSLVIEAGQGVQVLQWLATSFSFWFATGISSIFAGAGGDGEPSSSSSKGSLDSEGGPEW